MKIQEVIERATRDGKFAEELKHMAQSAQSAGLYSGEYREYMALFAESPEELAILTPEASQALGIKWTTITTITTVTTTTTAACATTTTTGTTTTTTDAPKYCDDEPPKVPKEVGAYRHS